jgi:hypothetical protein
MKPRIDDTSFGSITIDGETFEHDVVIRLSGAVEKRRKKLSKEVYGTAHVLSKDEAKYIFEKGAARIIIGTGQSGVLEISPEAYDWLEKRGCRVEALATPKAVRRWNEVEERVIGLFHVTC